MTTILYTTTDGFGLFAPGEILLSQEEPQGERIAPVEIPTGHIVIKTSFHGPSVIEERRNGNDSEYIAYGGHERRDVQTD